MDYIYIDVNTLESGEEQHLTKEMVRRIFACAKNGTLLDVVLREPRGEITHYSRVIGYTYDKASADLLVRFWSNGDAEVIQWDLTDPDIEES